MAAVRLYPFARPACRSASSEFETAAEMETTRQARCSNLELGRSLVTGLPARSAGANQPGRRESDPHRAVLARQIWNRVTRDLEKRKDTDVMALRISRAEASGISG